MSNKKEKKSNRKITKGIVSLMINGKYTKALSELSNYLEKYPNDIYMYPHFFDLLVMFGDYEYAYEIMEYIDLYYPEGCNKKYYFNKVTLLVRLGKYDDALNELNNIDEKEFTNSFSKSVLVGYLKKKINNQIAVAYDTYLVNQINDYSLDASKEHVIEQHFNVEYAPDVAKFNDDIDPNYIFDNVINNFSNSQGYPLGVINDLHIFRYEHAGYCEGKEVDYFYVITLPNSNEIITMYPHDNVSKLDFIDITPKIDLNGEYKRLSLVDRFTKKYNI